MALFLLPMFFFSSSSSFFLILLFLLLLLLLDNNLVSWFFKPSQPQRIISGLMETVIKRYTVERTNEAEIRPEEQSERVESCRENL